MLKQSPEKGGLDMIGQSEIRSGQTDNRRDLFVMYMAHTSE